MRKNNKQEAQRFLLSYLALNPTEKSTLLCNMIAIYAGKSNLTTKETEYITEVLNAMKGVLDNGVV
jgi:hypothetical protein